MRIDELKSLSSSEKRILKSTIGGYQSDTELKDELTKLGFDEISGGAYSDVYGKDDVNYVIKIAYNSSNYKRFVKYLKNKRFNKFFPRIYKIIQLTNATAYIMEKLYELSDEEVEKIDNFKVFYKERLKNPDKDLEHDFIGKYLKNALEVGYEMPEFLMVLIDLAKNDLLNDIGARNIMKRKNGQYVIIDPVIG